MPERPSVALDPPTSVLIIGDDRVSGWFEIALIRRLSAHDNPPKVRKVTHCEVLRAKDQPLVGVADITHIPLSIDDVFSADRIFVAGESESFCQDGNHERWNKALGTAVLEQLGERMGTDNALRQRLGRSHIRLYVYTYRADRTVLVEHFYCALGLTSPFSTVVNIWGLLGELPENIDNSGLYKAVFGEQPSPVDRPSKAHLEDRGITRLGDRQVGSALSHRSFDRTERRPNGRTHTGDMLIECLINRGARSKIPRMNPRIVESLQARIAAIFNGPVVVRDPIQNDMTVDPRWRDWGEVWRLLEEFFALDDLEPLPDPVDVKRQLIEGELADSNQRIAAGYALRMEDWRRHLEDETAGRNGAILRSLP